MCVSVTRFDRGVQAVYTIKCVFVVAWTKTGKEKRPLIKLIANEIVSRLRNALFAVRNHNIQLPINQKDQISTPTFTLCNMSDISMHSNPITFVSELYNQSAK